MIIWFKIYLERYISDFLLKTFFLSSATSFLVFSKSLILNVHIWAVYGMIYLRKRLWTLRMTGKAKEGLKLYQTTVFAGFKLDSLCGPKISKRSISGIMNPFLGKLWPVRYADKIRNRCKGQRGARVMSTNRFYWF